MGAVRRLQEGIPEGLWLRLSALNLLRKILIYERGVRREPGDGVKIEPYPAETIAGLVRRFKKATQRGNILTDARRHEHFIPKSERRRIKSRKARARRAL
jgi:ribosomal protein S21